MTTRDDHPTIRVVLPSGQRTAYRVVAGSSVVGRGGDVPLRIPFDQVSRRHAEIYWDGERLCVRDLGSSNGTSVNGRSVVGWVDLSDGDLVRFADIDAHVDVGGPPPERRAPARNPRISQRPVFVSHGSEDKAVARTVARYLQHAGWQVWIDEEGIAGGKEWHSALINSLESAWIVLLVVSYHSMRSRWVVREVQAADRLGLRIIPIVVEDMPYPDELRLILSPVQQLHLTRSRDGDLELYPLHDALIEAARPRGARRRSPPVRPS